MYDHNKNDVAPPDYIFDIVEHDEQSDGEEDRNEGMIDDGIERHEYFAKRIFRASADIIRPSPDQLEEAENANLFELSSS